MKPGAAWTYRYRFFPLATIVPLLLLITGTHAPAAETTTTSIEAPAVGFAPTGRKIYLRRCAECHGRDLEGAGGPPLAGISFQSQWNGRAAHDLHTIITDTMPPDEIGSLTADDVTHIYTYILTANNYQRDSAVLESDRSMPAAVANYAVPVPDTLPAAPNFFGAATEMIPTSSELADVAASDWPMYNRDYKGQRYSPLSQITPANVASLAPKCIFQAGEVGAFQASPLIHNGRLYVTTPYFTYALNATTCEKLWENEHIPEGPSGSAVNRGAALYAGKIFRGTPDSHLIAIDAATGATLWDVWVADSREGYRLSAAPAVFDGKVFIGEGGADVGASGHVHAFDAETGERLWTFNMIPKKGEPGFETWKDGIEYGGGSTWSHITVDPQSGQIYVPIGNPGSSLDGSVRPGANLFTNSIVALDADTGTVNWHIQQVPHDVWDWDTAAAPVLYEANGSALMAVASKDGWLYLYDETSRELLTKREISTHVNADKPPTVEGLRICPGTLGGTEWFGPALDLQTNSLFVNSVDWCTTLYVRTNPRTPFAGTIKFDPIDDAKGWLRAFDSATGQPKWVYEADTPMLAGITPTAGGLVFTGTLNGEFLAFDAESGKILYRFNTGGAIAGGISSYAVEDQQYIAVASGNASKTIWSTKGAATVVIFGLP